MSNVSKGLNSVSGGVVRQKNVPTFNIPKPKEEPEEILEQDKVKQVPGLEVEKGKVSPVVEEIPISLDVDYFEAFKNYRPKYETHKQITVRIPASMDAELNKIAKGKKGAKQELITRGIEREIALIKRHEQTSSLRRGR